MADLVQFDHDQLPGISQRFGTQADQVRAQYAKITQQMDKLRSGAWIGPNANAFYEVMDNQLLPACKRLSDALDRANETTQQVAKMMRDADEESKGYFPT